MRQPGADGLLKLMVSGREKIREPKRKTMDNRYMLAPAAADGEPPCPSELEAEACLQCKQINLVDYFVGQFCCHEIVDPESATNAKAEFPV